MSVLLKSIVRVPGNYLENKVGNTDLRRVYRTRYLVRY